LRVADSKDRGDGHDDMPGLPSLEWQLHTKARAGRLSDKH
jgi:hypothetical protein